MHIENKLFKIKSQVKQVVFRYINKIQLQLKLKLEIF